MKNKILNFFDFSRKKIIILLILIVLAALTIYLSLGAMMGCALSWGCDILSLGSFAVYLLGWLLVYPAYFIYIAPQIVFGDFPGPTSVMLVIMIVIEVIYLYILSCVIMGIIGFIKKRKSEIVKKNKKPWSRRTVNLVIFASFAVIMLFDGLAFPRRFDYVLELANGSSLYIAKFSTALKITAFIVFEIWYLVFLFSRRKNIVWNKFFLAVIWLVTFVLLALNIMMLVLSLFGFGR